MTDVLLKRRQRHSGKEGYVTMEAEMRHKPRNSGSHWKLGEAEGHPSPTALGGSAALRHLDFGLLASKNFSVKTPDQHPGREIRVSISSGEPWGQQRP